MPKYSKLDNPMQLILPTGQDVKKSNTIVRARLHCDDRSVYAGRILAGLISCIKVDDEKFAETYSISAKNLITASDDSGYARLRNTCKNMMSTRAEFDWINPKTKENEFLLINFFESIKYENGIISATFTCAIEPHLLQLRENFTKFKLIEYIRLSSTYSQRLFEILKSWSGMSGPIKIDIDQMHNMLDTSTVHRKNYMQLRTKILEPAYREITTKTELRYNWRPLKKGGERSKTGKVYAIEFTIINNDNNTPKKEKLSSRREAELMAAAGECAGRVGAGVCYEDNDEKVCSVCNEYGIFKGIKRKLT